MTTTIEQDIRELEALRKRTRAWRLGATCGAILIVVGSVGVMNNAIQNLFRPGPVQEEFVSEVSTNLQRDVVPEVQRLAVQTIGESRPIVETEFRKLNTRVPELTQVSLEEFNKFQAELPVRTEKVLDESYGAMLKEREPKLRALFPNATDEQIQTLIHNLTDEGYTRLSNINHKLFAPHMSTMMAIHADIRKIEQQEARYTKEPVPSWQMGSLLFDIARADLKGADLPGLESPIAPAKKPVSITRVRSTNAIPKKPLASTGY